MRGMMGGFLEEGVEPVCKRQAGSGGKVDRSRGMVASG